MESNHSIRQSGNSTIWISLLSNPTFCTLYTRIEWIWQKRWTEHLPFFSIREFNRDSIIVAHEGVSGDYLAARSLVIPPILDFVICSYHPRRPREPHSSLSLFLSLFLLCSAISETRQEDALIIRSRRSFHRDGRTGRDGVRNHIFQVMPVNAANKRPGKSVPGPVSMAYASRDLDGRPTAGERKKKKRNINYAHHSPAP